jgi:flagellar hook-associated protein 1
MLNLFGTLDMASRSMSAQMTALNVTGQNLANVDTAGYTRQTVDIESSPEISTSIGPEGTGADVAAIQQAVSSTLNAQVVTQGSSSGYWTAQQSALESLQTNLDEFLNGTASTSSSSSDDSTSDTGLGGQLSSLFDDFQAVATSPTSISARQALISQAQTVSSTFNQIDSQFSSTKASLNSTLTSDVTSANQLLSGIAQLNGQIASAEFGGGTANDLLDQQQVDLQSLAQLTNIQTSTSSNGQVDVSIDGQSMVSGDQVTNSLQTYDASGNGSGQLLLQTVNGGTDLTLTGGSMQGTIDVRDGELATMQNSINSLASSLITQVNSINSNGYNLNGTTGTAFFTGTDASDIAVNPALANDPSLVQASGSATASGDNTVALELANLATTPQSNLDDQTLGGSYDETVANLGNTLQSANTQVTNQTAVANMLSTQQSSVSGVNIDQEMTNLLGFQRAYEASAELVTTVNEMMETVNNMTST